MRATRVHRPLAGCQVCVRQKKTLLLMKSLPLPTSDYRQVRGSYVVAERFHSWEEMSTKSLKRLATPKGFEPSTLRLGITYPSYSLQRLPPFFEPIPLFLNDKATRPDACSLLPALIKRYL